MNESATAFDPDLKPEFSQSAYRAARRYRQDGRSLFHALLQDCEDPALYPVAYHFVAAQWSRRAATGQVEPPDSLADQSILNALPVKASAPAAPTPGPYEDCLLQTQPVLLTEACWLRHVLLTATNQAPVAIALAAVYSSFCAKHPPAQAFRALLLEAGLDIPDLASMAFAEQDAIDALFFDFAALQLALAQFPRVYFPELLGFTLAYCQSPSLLAGLAASEHPGLAHYLNQRRQHLVSATPAVLAAIRDYLGQFADRKSELWRRIASGFELYRDYFEQCECRLRHRREHPETASEAVARMLTHKAPAALGHHRPITLAGRALDDWFAEIPFDSAHFLSALRCTPYVDRQNPAASPLLKLFEFKGPMFGIFSDNDKQCLLRWLIEADTDVSAAPCPVEPEHATNWLPDQAGGSPPRFANMSRRELYHYLVNADLYPDSLPAARLLVRKVLRTARWCNRLPFQKYSHQAFAAYIDTLYQREVKAYQPLAGKPRLSRQAYVFGIEQLAPAILADGCWLQQASRLGFSAQAAVGAILSRIYDDETGNGIADQNHPVIYRQLLDSLAIDLPPIRDRAFCRHPGFIDSAFDIPVYLLAISQFPATFLPELLGLNMAIELSGLGRVYLRLAEELRYWGIDPTIVNVHVTIDNLASGHAALARTAIQRYLDQIGASQGEAAKDAHWRRIHHGYRSLATVSRAFKFSLLLYYLSKKLRGRCTGRPFFTHRFDQNA